MPSNDRPSPATRTARWGLGLTLVAGLLAMLSGPFYQMKWLALFPAFGLLRWSVYGALAGAAVCLLALVIGVVQRSRAGGRLDGAAAAAIGLIIGFAVYYVPTSVRAGNPPPIHDVTTDTDDPPALIAAIAQRNATGATNTPEYDRLVKSPRGGPELNVPELQKKAFPDIGPIRLEVPPEQAFQRALDATQTLGWTLIEQNAAEGRIEASDKTTWFGFIDDVVIRVRADGAGSRVDVRSVSRIGFGDVGKNAQRIRAYRSALTGND
jgi:uncharacterized protein (DUF1499 family)